MTASPAPAFQPLRYRSAAGRWALLATVLGSGIAFLDASVVNIALPAIGAEFAAGLGALQWTVSAYALSLASFILLGGSLGDRYGRRRIFLIGVVWFAFASLACGIAPTVDVLIIARVLQGMGAALLTPGSLAILQASFAEEDRGQVIGIWSGLAGVTAAIGPFVGGWLVQSVSWRLVFLINLPLAALVVLIGRWHLPETLDPDAPKHFDVAGATLCALGLAGLTYGLITWGTDGGIGGPAVLALIVGVLGLTAFLVVERRSRQPMMPLSVFASPVFRAVNLVTLLVYAALGGVFFMLVLALQVVAGFSPLLAGTALLPVTVVMLLLSPAAGRLGQRIGPRLPMTVGPLVAAAAVLLLARVGPGASYLIDVLPAVTLFGLGLAATVSPLTATVLAAVPSGRAGIASGVNNAVARTGGLLIIAVLPLAVGLTGDGYADPTLLAPAYRLAMLGCAALLAIGGLLSLVLLRDTRPVIDHPSSSRAFCAVAGTPLDVDSG